MPGRHLVTPFCNHQRRRKPCLTYIKAPPGNPHLHRLITVDAAKFAWAEGNETDFSGFNEVLLHQEDSTPLMMVRLARAILFDFPDRVHSDPTDPGRHPSALR